MKKENILRIRLTFEEATPEDLVVRSESYGARIAGTDASDLARFASNTVLRNFPDFLKETK